MKQTPRSRRVTLAVNFPEAFNTIIHNRLLDKISHTGVNHTVFVLSLLLFNFFVSSFFSNVDLVTSYAGKFILADESINVCHAAATISIKTDEVVTWAEEEGLVISISKTILNLLSLDSHQTRVNPGDTLGGQ